MSQHYGSEYDQLISSVGEAVIEKHWRSPKNLLLQHKTAGRLLDLGCSSGGFLASLKSTSWKLYGIEMSDAVAERARTASGAEVYVGDIVGAPYASQSFDAITCFNVLEHVYRPREVLAKVQQWLKPDGVFITFLPNIHSGAARLFGSHWYALEAPRHLYHFSPKTLRELARTAGFEEVTVTTHREPFIELSLKYIKDTAQAKLGISTLPLAQAKMPGIAWRVMRKAFRLTLLPVLNRLVGVWGPGEIIHAVFRKRVGN